MTGDATRRELTELLHRWRGGDETALSRLMALVYPELRRMARGYLRSERPDHTLQATALVNEAYLRLVGVDVDWQDRVHFFAVAARVMRRVLVDYAKSGRRAKRGGAWTRLELDEATGALPTPSADVLALDEALERLTAIDERKARIIELRFFGGSSYGEIGAALGLSSSTVKRELKFARAWLASALAEGETERG